uniref:Rab-GAP TBC domain-containing protein n=1 Tax=Globodera rostochiensis TaxID=31243 RepID=A0A914HXC5_GLORO
MQRNWAQQNVPFPGSVKPVYGAQFPPLQSSTESGDSPTKTDKKFKNYEKSVSDVWDPGVPVDDSLVLSAAAKVLERHAAGQQTNDPATGGTTHVNQRHSKIQAMQRLATQREPIPGVNPVPSPANSGSFVTPSLYPRLPEVSRSRPTSTQSTATTSPNVGVNKSTTASPGRAVAIQTKESKNGDVSRLHRLRRILGLSSVGSDGKRPAQGTVVDLDELRKECWLGIPHRIRPLAWRLLSDYIPTSLDRHEMTLNRKRDEYWHYVEQYFHTRYDEQHQITFRQIHIDIPRMCPLIPLFQQKKVQEIFERVLYIWAIRHPASGYVQGINDLVTPFFIVFLSEFIPDEMDMGTFDLAHLSREQVEIVEADSFWCVSALLDTIQDNYTFAQPGIQRKVSHLKELVSRVEPILHSHFESNGVEFLQFSFRWMNNLLMREIPLRATIRLWDTYLSERDGFSQFHTYICGAFLRLWSKQLLNERDFQGVMLLLQNLPTQGWNDQQICELTADAYSLMQFFHRAKSHLQT